MRYSKDWATFKSTIKLAIERKGMHGALLCNVCVCVRQLTLSGKRNGLRFGKARAFRYPVDHPDHPGQTDHVICVGTDWEEGE
jgi:hypothetical protein